MKYMVGIAVEVSEHLRKVKDTTPYHIWRVLVLSTDSALNTSNKPYYKESCGFNEDQDREFAEISF